MLGQDLEFYEGLTKKYVAIFGNLFNNIYISRSDGTNSKAQNFRVPLGYGPREKYLGRLKEDPELVRDAAILLPRMSYEAISFAYAPNRALNPYGKITKVETIPGGKEVKQVFTAVPYDVFFQVNIMTKTNEDGLRIIEQILPFFKPDFTVTAHLLEEMPSYKIDLPITLTNVTNDDTYEGDFVTRRALIWTLNFTMKAVYYSNIGDSKVIKIAKTNIYPAMEKTLSYSKTTIYPGMTANGEPTTDPSQTVPYNEIEQNDNWDYIVIKEDIIDDE